MNRPLRFLCLILLVASASLSASCDSADQPTGAPEASTQSTAEIKTPEASTQSTAEIKTPEASAQNAAEIKTPEASKTSTADAATSQPPPQHHGHGASPASIDCPLRKAGHDPTKMRPFEDVAEYIAFLERPDRMTWQKPDEVIDALALSGDEVVVDLGAGSGYFAFRFAEKLPRGRVDALDVEPEMVRHLHHNSMTRGVENLHADFTDTAKPQLPSDVDLVFVCDVLHHIPDPQAWLAEIVKQLSAGDRLVLIEFREGSLPHGPPEGTKIPRARLLEMATQAGLELKTDHPSLLPYQYMMTFQPTTSD